MCVCIIFPSTSHYTWNCSWAQQVKIFSDFRFTDNVFVSTIQLEKTVRDVRIFTTTPPGSLEERVQQTSAEVTQIDINVSLFNVLFKKKKRLLETLSKIFLGFWLIHKCHCDSVVKLMFAKCLHICKAWTYKKIRNQFSLSKNFCWGSRRSTSFCRSYICITDSF